MKITSLYSGGYASNAYLVTSDDESESVLIDPSVSYDFVFRQCGDFPKVKKVLLTHAHFDHVIALEEWKNNYGVEIYATEKASLALTDSVQNGNRIFFGSDKTYPKADVIISEGDVICFGNSELKVIETRGHTQGSCCYIGEGVAFTGDTLFADGDVGRTDLYGGSTRELYRSISRLFSTLDGSTVIYSGHGRPSTVREEIYNHRANI
ncbi:MAG: MBL fold metallo-hydrolase [Clostridia bacterium]|jgi:glyoxylase-like metal-dependent hydrolase (beta-lactamase superfamily II)|nr:MBL fold metallo-hydrolase [Clostridia bacterium]